MLAYYLAEQPDGGEFGTAVRLTPWSFDLPPAAGRQAHANLTSVPEAGVSGLLSRMTMFSHQLYNVVHIVGIVLVMSALGGLAFHVFNGGTRANNGAHRLMASLHGAGLLLVLVGGFGMLARLGFQHGASFPGWLWVKLAVWLVLGAALMLPHRRPTLAKPLLLLLPVLGGLAAYMAIYKPI